MRRILHLAWFDVLALRVPLSAWVTLLLVEGTLFYLGPFDSVGGPEFDPFSVTLGLMMARWGATVVMIALLVHADPTVSTTAFWRSRPISRPALLASKLLSAFLWCVALPGVVTMVVLLLLGMDPLPAGAGGSTTSFEQLVIVLVVLALAIVTTGLVQLVEAAVVGLGIWLAADQALVPAALSTWPALERALPNGPRFAIAAVVAGLVGLVAVHQYVTLRTWRSMALLACAIMFASAAPRMGTVASRGPLPWPAPVAASLIAPSEVSLSVDTGTQLERQPSRALNDKGTPVRGLSFELVTSGEPTAIRFRPAEITSRLEFPDHSIATWSRRWPTDSMLKNPVRATAADQPYRSVRQALGNPDLNLPPYLRREQAGLAVFEIPESQWQRYRGQPTRLEANVTMLAYQYKAMAALPLRAGGRMSLPNGGVVSLESARRTQSGVTVLLRETYLETGAGGWLAAGGRDFVLRNAPRQLALFGSNSGLRLSAYTWYFGASRVRTIERELVFAVPGTAAAGPAMADDWMKNAELIRVDMALIGTITRPLRIDNLVIGAGQK